MKIHTGNFWMPVPEESMKISVANSVPPGFRADERGPFDNSRLLYKLRLLIPDWSIVVDYKEGKIDDIKYTENYTTKLYEKLQVNDRISLGEKIVEHFLDLSERFFCNNFQLCCWEPRDKFCHRFIVYDLLPDKYRGERN
jgi:hypothetical protein